MLLGPNQHLSLENFFFTGEDYTKTVQANTEIRLSIQVVKMMTL